MSQFYAQARAGDLPAVSWIDPRFSAEVIHVQGNDDHPPADIRNGQQLVADVYHALLNGRDNLWEKTLLIVTYDEHGGFYDHVDPRAFDPANPSVVTAEAATIDSRITKLIKTLWRVLLSLFGLVEKDPTGPANQYGVRVPILLASPWIDAGTVSHTVYDHTSIIKTILKRFGKSGVDMGPRVAKANDLSALLNRDSLRADRPQAPVVDSQLGEPRPDAVLQAEAADVEMTDLQRLIREHQKLRSESK
jgi:phospholipase C